MSNYLKELIKKEEELFNKAREFMWDNYDKSISIDILVKETGIERKLINKWIDEGRLSLGSKITKSTNPFFEELIKDRDRKNDKKDWRMKKFILFLIINIYIFPIEKNFSIGRYTQEGFYKGQGRQNFNFVVLNYGSFYIQGSEIGGTIYNKDFKIIPFIKYDSITGMKNEDLEDELKLLNSRNHPKLLGIKFEKNYKNIDCQISFGKDFTSNAYKISSLIQQNFRPFKPLFIIPSIELSYYGEKYGDYFYGISQEESLKTNLEIHQENDGFILDLNLSFMMFFSEKVGISLRGGYKKIDSKWRSPILDKTESFNASFVFIYRFL